MGEVVIDVTVAAEFQTNMLLACLASAAGSDFPVVARQACSPLKLSAVLGWTEAQTRAALLGLVATGDLVVSSDRRTVTITSKRVRYQRIRKRGAGRPETPTEQELALFSVWRRGLGKNSHCKLSKARLKSLRRALTPEPKGYGFDAETLLSSIHGWVEYCKGDPWRMERLNRHDLTLILRDVEHIEEGLHKSSDAFTPESELAMREANERGKLWRCPNT